MLTRDHTVLPATHTFIHKWNEPYLTLLPSCIWANVARKYFTLTTSFQRWIYKCQGPDR